jgi:hypothetical protein
MAAGVARMFDHDGVGQAVLVQPFLEHDTAAARIGQYGNQRNAREIFRHVGKIERQTGAHHDGVRTALARLAHISGVRADGLHHVYRNRTVVLRKGERTPDFAVQRDEIRLIEPGFVAAAIGCGQQVRVMMAQIDAGDGAHRAELRHRTRQPVRRDADAHAALHDRQQCAAFQVPQSKITQTCC